MKGNNVGGLLRRAVCRVGAVGQTGTARATMTAVHRQSTRHFLQQNFRTVSWRRITFGALRHRIKKKIETDFVILHPKMEIIAQKTRHTCELQANNSTRAYNNLLEN